MANSILTPTAVTREILRIAHEKCSFIGTTQRQYDSQFARAGGRIGDSLKIRLPNKYTVRTGKTLNAQDTSEESVTLTTATQKGVDMVFSSAELTLELDEFSKRVLQPAVATLVSVLEADMLESVSKEVYNHVGTPGTLPTFLQLGQAKAKLNQYLAPKDNNRHIQMESIDMAGVVNELKGLFHDSTEISKQYREGMVGRALGLNWTENERIYVHTNSTDHTSITVNDTVASGDSVITLAGAAMSVGSIFTIADVKAVHPETKVAYAHDQQFVVTAVDGNDYSISPAIISTGAKQNVDHLPSSSDVVTAVGTASTSYPNHLVYHEEAFAFVSADLEMPSGVDFAAREVMDGLSVRVVRQYDVNNDNFPCRIDILHGYKALRPEWACRVMGKGS